MKTTKHYELVNEKLEYLNDREYSDDDLIAAILVINKNGKEISRDQVIKKEWWAYGSDAAIKARKNG